MMNTVIQKISARQVLDCKARPMLEVDVFTQDGSMGRGAAPTGTSVGAHEAFVLRDYDVNEFNGLSVHKAVNTVETVIAPALLGMDAADQRAIDQRMLEPVSYTHLGVNHRLLIRSGIDGDDTRSVSYTHLDVYKRQQGGLTVQLVEPVAADAA